jgi:pimeloyl-ACP methyl ester carboxylesterase
LGGRSLGGRSRALTAPRLTEFVREDLRFRVRDEGLGDSPPVILLHGFPESSATWDAVAPALADSGRRVLAPDQRGYSPGARPSDVRRYRVEELGADVLALADAAGARTFDLVGHDWGGAVAWYLATAAPDRLRTLTVLSTPHPRAMARSLVFSTQALRSSYVAFFQVPRLPELLLGVGLERMLRSSGLGPNEAAAVHASMSEPGALSAALSWYRAARPWTLWSIGPIDVPTLYVWGTRDPALGREAAEHTEHWVRGPYRFEVLDGVGHWIQREASDRLLTLLHAHLEAATHHAAGPVRSG